MPGNRNPHFYGEYMNEYTYTKKEEGELQESLKCISNYCGLTCEVTKEPATYYLTRLSMIHGKTKRLLEKYQGR